MSFQARLQAFERETWPSLESAAFERFWDGVDLATSAETRRTGSIYLMGYVAEMLLKVAFFRVMGYPPGDKILLKTIEVHSAWTGGKKFHNLENLADLLIAERVLRGTAFNPAFAGQLKACVLTVASHWRETLRYRHTPATQTELVEVYQSVDWLCANATLLWS